MFQYRRQEQKNLKRLAVAHYWSLSSHVLRAPREHFSAILIYSGTLQVCKAHDPPLNYTPFTLNSTSFILKY